MKLRIIRADGVRLVAKPPLEVAVHRCRKKWYGEVEELYIVGSSEKSKAGMITDLCQTIKDQWQYYSKLPKSKCWPEALRLKKLYAERFTECN